jgi:hypothetical protein
MKAVHRLAIADLGEGANTGVNIFHIDPESGPTRISNTKAEANSNSSRSDNPSNRNYTAQLLL